MARTHSSEAPGRTCQLRQLASRTEGGTVLPPPRHRGDDDVTRGEVCSLEPPEGGEPRRAGCAEQQREQARHADKPTRRDDTIDKLKAFYCAFLVRFSPPPRPGSVPSLSAFLLPPSCGRACGGEPPSSR